MMHEEIPLLGDQSKLGGQVTHSVNSIYQAVTGMSGIQRVLLACAYARGNDESGPVDETVEQELLTALGVLIAQQLEACWKVEACVNEAERGAIS